MGTFRVSIGLGDPQGQHYEPLDVLVDTGASYTIAPSALLRRLGVEVHGKEKFILANGAELELAIGQTWVQIDGRRVITLVVFGTEGMEPILGAYTLEGLRLAPDPVNRRLIPVPGLLM